MEVEVGSLALVIKRRTLLYSLVVLVATIITGFIFAYELKDAAPPELGLVDYEAKEPDLSVKWEDFYHKFSGRSRNRERHYNEVFNNEFRYKVIKWSGTVLRVDSFDELDEFEGEGESYVISGNQDKEARHKYAEQNLHNTDSNNMVDGNGYMYQAQVHVKMEPRYATYPHSSPSQVDKGEKADIRYQTDLLLWFDGEHFDRNADVIDRLQKGDQITFTGYLRSLKVIGNTLVHHRNVEIHGEDALPHVQTYKIQKDSDGQ